MIHAKATWQQLVSKCGTGVWHRGAHAQCGNAHPLRTNTNNADGETKQRPESMGQEGTQEIKIWWHIK